MGKDSPSMKARHWLACLGVCVGMSAVGAQTPLPAPKPMANAAPSAAPAEAEPTKLALGQCIAIGLEKHPNMRAALYSLQAAQVGAEGINKVPAVAEIFRGDLGIRKQQANLGVTAAVADVKKVHDEIIHDISLMYYSYVYAKQQEEIASNIVSQLAQFKKIIEDFLKSGEIDPKVNVFSLYQIVDGLQQAKQAALLAKEGRQTAIDALKQAMGVEQSFNFVPKDEELPTMKGVVTKELIIETALGYRPEMTMAAAGVDVFRLEVKAQDKTKAKFQVLTFAGGSDLHSKAIPSALRDTDYRPAPTTPEMPPFMIGSRKDRVQKTCLLSMKQDAIYDGVKDLVTLEASRTFYHWQKASDSLTEAKLRFDNGRKMAELAEKSAATLDKEKLILYIVTSGRAQSEYLTAAYEAIKAMLAMERVTAGQVKPNFPGK